MTSIPSLQFPRWTPDEGIFRVWWFDPLVATLSFTLFIHVYWYQERKRGVSSNNTFRETCGLGWGPLYNSLGAYWVGIYLLQCFQLQFYGQQQKQKQQQVTIHRPDGIPTSFCDAIYLIMEVVMGVIVYDALMFFVHWAMHEIPCCHRWHVRHHHVVSNHHHRVAVESRDTLRHSLWDGSWQVLCNILAQQISPPFGRLKSRLARALHNVLVIWMLTESHTSSPYPNIWRRWCVGVAHHHVHHHAHAHAAHDRIQKWRSIANDDDENYSFRELDRYQQFFGYLDDLRMWWYRKRKYDSKKDRKRHGTCALATCIEKVTEYPFGSLLSMPRLGLAYFINSQEKITESKKQEEHGIDVIARDWGQRVIFPSAVISSV